MLFYCREYLKMWVEKHVIKCKKLTGKENPENVIATTAK